MTTKSGVNFRAPEVWAAFAAAPMPRLRHLSLHFNVLQETPAAGRALGAAGWLPGLEVLRFLRPRTEAWRGEPASYPGFQALEASAAFRRLQAEGRVKLDF